LLWLTALSLAYVMIVPADTDRFGSQNDYFGSQSFLWCEYYRLVGKYMPQPHALRSRVCLSWQYISTVCSLRKAK
jgi:hypothetical protein